MNIFSFTRRQSLAAIASAIGTAATFSPLARLFGRSSTVEAAGGMASGSSSTVDADIPTTREEWDRLARDVATLERWANESAHPKAWKLLNYLDFINWKPAATADEPHIIAFIGMAPAEKAAEYLGNIVNLTRPGNEIELLGCGQSDDGLAYVVFVRATVSGDFFTRERIATPGYQRESQRKGGGF